MYSQSKRSGIRSRVSPFPFRGRRSFNLTNTSETLNSPQESSDAVHRSSDTLSEPNPTITEESKVKSDNIPQEFLSEGSKEHKVSSKQCGLLIQVESDETLHAVSPSSVEVATANEGDLKLPISTLDPKIEFHKNLHIFESTRRISFFTTVTKFLDCKGVNKTAVENLVKELIAKCLEKPFWSTVLASNIHNLVLHTEMGQHLKCAFIQRLQYLYDNLMDSAELNDTNKLLTKEFRNLVILLGETFLRYRVNPSCLKRYQVYSSPLCKLLTLLCKSDKEEDIKVLTRQISVNGEAMKLMSSDCYNTLLLEIRLRILETDDSAIKIWLLLAIDIACYGDISEPIKNMYTNILGPSLFDELKSPSEQDLSDIIPKTELLRIICD